MEIIKSLKKKENKRGSLSKLKIDLSKSPLKNVEKIISYIARDLKDIDLANTDPSEYMKFNYFNIDIYRLFNSNLIKKVTPRFSKEEVKLYETTVFDDNGELVEIFIMPETKIPDKTRIYHYKLPTNQDRRKILDIRYLYGLLKCLDIVYDEVSHNEKFYFSEEFKKISLSKSTYSSDVLPYIIDIFYNTKASLYCLSKNDFKLYEETLLLIIDVISLQKDIDLNIELSEKHEKNANSECARAFETKKNIPYKVLSVMNSNKFLNDFSYVELDEDTDINKFRILENEWEKVKAALNLEKYLKNIKPELRFKKLGKHRALGLYYPSLYCICIDITSPSSFVHEFGHFIDYTTKKGQLSLSIDFYPIIIKYKAAYNKYILENPDSDDLTYLRKKSEYFFAPTEIFARTLEIYLVNKGMKSSFIKEKEDLTITSGYPEISDNFLDEINEYFDKIIKTNLKKLEDNKSKSKKKINYIEPIMTTGQLYFNLNL